MDIERLFAAAVFNAEQDAAKARASGYPEKTASDMVTAALIDLWGHGAVDGLIARLSKR
jgi:hypothetical protein